MKIRTSNKGFTIVELLIATTILTTVLVSASFVLVQVGRLYYKGNITAKTQQATRNIVDSISRPIQLQGGNLIGPSGPASQSYICIGLQRFTYQTVQQVGVACYNHALIRDTLSDPAACGTNVPPLTGSVPPGGESMLSDGMRLFELNVGPGASPGVYEVTVRAGYGEITSFNGTQDGCLSQLAGGQFCAYTSYKTSVSARIR